MNQLMVLMLINGFIALAKGKGGCKVLDFFDCLKNKMFTGHVIKSFRVLAPGLENCQHKCFLEDKCVSYNLGPVEGTIRSCELNDADHVSDPGHVVSEKDFEYCPIKNPCSSSPCHSYQWCTPDFYWDTFNCSDGKWTQWGMWSCSCPRTRTRRCITPQNTNGKCDDKDSDTDSKECRAVSDIKDGRWTRWGKWSCSCPRTRTRRYITPQNTNGKCDDKDSDTDSKGSRAASDIKGCSKPLVLWDVRIKHGQTSASSHHHGVQCFSPPIDLGSITLVTKITTHGRNVVHQWVTEYSLSFSNDTETWQSYKGDQECVKRFTGNADRNTVVTHSLPVPIKARYFRFVAQKWRGHTSMRVKLYGCTSV